MRFVNNSRSTPCAVERGGATRAGDGDPAKASTTAVTARMSTF
jgi:hypothetical protein